MKRKYVIWISAVLGLCILATLAGYATGLKKPHRNIAFTLHGKRIHWDADGNKIASDVIRYESADGNWRLVETTADGHMREQFFVQGRGHFVVDAGRQRLLRNERVSKDRDNVVRSVTNDLLNSPQFSRTELLLGHTAYVMQIHDGSILMAETYIVPELGRSPVKIISYDAAGQVIMVLEPENITLGEPAASDLKGPDYPEVTTK